MNGTGLFSTIDSKERLVHRVVDQITELILDHQLEAGTKLPPETKLAEMIGVSRTVLREAMQILSAKGLVETRHGFGTVVQNVDSSQLYEQLSIMLQTNDLTLDNLHQVRTMLEVEIVGIAAAQATEAEICELSQLVESLEAEDDLLTCANLDGKFHSLLACISHNPMLILLHDSVGDILQTVRLSVSNYPELFMAGMSDHRLIMERVKEHDVPGARQIMRAHLERARKIQQQAFGDHQPLPTYTAFSSKGSRSASSALERCMPEKKEEAG